MGVQPPEPRLPYLENPPRQIPAQEGLSDSQSQRTRPLAHGDHPCAPAHLVPGLTTHRWHLVAALQKVTHSIQLALKSRGVCEEAVSMVKVLWFVMLHELFPPKLTETSLQSPPGAVARQLVRLEGGVVTVGHRLFGIWNWLV